MKKMVTVCVVCGEDIGVSPYEDVCSSKCDKARKKGDD